MLLQRFIDIGRVPAGLLALLVFAGCASGGLVTTSESGAESRRGNVVEGEEAAVIIPPQAQTMYEQAVSSMAAGDFVDSELRFKEFLLQYPDYPGAHVNLAIIHANNENNEAAKAALDAALTLNPSHPAALNQLGMLLRRNGKFLEAEAAYLKAVTANPDYALAHYNLGVLNELYLQRLDVALQHFEIYQTLVGEDKQVEKWIADLRRRIAASQRTANVAD
ncbi:MAG: tetratricopeptide repeat protein [Gammaproteobacteria bacterium]|nr:tetratricopeptide repeat protein [Gammaproteobacteria bacterium]